MPEIHRLRDFLWKAWTMADADDKRPKPDLPESTLRIMDRMLKTPPKPHEKAVREKELKRSKSAGGENAEASSKS